MVKEDRPASSRYTFTHYLLSTKTAITRLPHATDTTNTLLGAREDINMKGL